MIFVSQGHQLSIGLEVFFKALSLMSSRERKFFHLVGCQSSIDETLKSIATHLNLSGLTYHYFQPSHITQSEEALKYCLKKIKPRDILITLPTTKDQLPEKRGHSEFFRKLYQKEHLSMVFESLNDRILLVTDHIPLKQVTTVVDTSLITAKVQTTLEGYDLIKISIQEVIFSGLNPHAGEKGLLGREDSVVTCAVGELEKLFPHIRFRGPYSADTLHYFKKNSSERLFVYMYHDQGLPRFKSEYGTIGVHFTFGLPFLRMSVDHGTAFNLYKKDRADYMGMYYLLKWALECH